MASLTEKELNALEDQLAQEQLLVRKFKMYSETASDPAIKSACAQIADRHKQHFNTLMGHLY